MIKKIIHANDCYECGEKIYSVADVERVGDDVIFRHPKCVKSSDTDIKKNESEKETRA